MTGAGAGGMELRSLLASALLRVDWGWQQSLAHSPVGMVMLSHLFFWPQQKHLLIETLQRAPLLWKFVISHRD